MKKLFSILFVLLLLCPTALAEIDWTGMTAEEIQTEINRARAEIVTRDIKTDEKGTVILDTDGITVSITSAEVLQNYDGTYRLLLKYTAANTLSTPIGFTVDKVYLNGWEICGLVTATLEGGMKARKEDSFYSVDVDADVSSYEDIEDLKFIMHTYDPDTYHRKTEDIECTVYFNK